MKGEKCICLYSRDGTPVKLNPETSMSFFHDVMLLQPKGGGGAVVRVECKFAEGVVLREVATTLESLVGEGIRDTDEFCEKLFASLQHDPFLVGACIQLFEVKGSVREIARKLESIVARRLAPLQMDKVQRSLYDVLKDYLATTTEMSPNNLSPMFYYGNKSLLQKK